jgi:hypothetical protein
MNGGHDSAEFGEGSDDPGVLGRWTESMEDEGGGGMLQHGREGAEQKRGMGWRPTAFECAWARGRGEKREAGGSGGGRHMEGRNGKERGGPGVVGDASGGRHRPPGSGRGWRRCHVTVEGGASC